MKKPSGNRVNLAIMIIVIVVLALGLAAILGYGKARKQMEQMQQAQQEAKEVSVTPTQTVTPVAEVTCLYTSSTCSRPARYSENALALPVAIPIWKASR